MYAPDLDTRCQVAWGDVVRAVGWLEHGKPFTTGPTDPRFRAALRAHVTDAGHWQPLIMLGVHLCDLGDCTGVGGAQWAVFPAPTCVYVVPELIVHYVEHHTYKPPDEFIAAVLACPEQSSEAYVAMVMPFRTTWALGENTVRAVAADAPLKRRLRAEAQALAAASRGNFTW